MTAVEDWQRAVLAEDQWTSSSSHREGSDGQVIWGDTLGYFCYTHGVHPLKQSRFQRSHQLVRGISLVNIDFEGVSNSSHSNQALPLPTLTSCFEVGPSRFKGKSRTHSTIPQLAYTGLRKRLYPIKTSESQDEEPKTQSSCLEEGF